jgi:hypothetical protein
MTNIRNDPKLRDLAEFAAHFSEHRDITELHRRGWAVIAKHEESSDLAELASTYVDNPEHRDELLRSAREVLAKPVEPMQGARRVGVGVYLTVLGLVLFAVTPNAWSIATDVATSGASKVTFWGLDFRATPAMATIAIVILMAIIGSVTVMTLVFGLRAGNNTLEAPFVWWYVTRPITAAGLAVLFYVTAISGLLDLGAITGASALVIAAALAALAGLFTDQVLEKMRGMLGLLPFHETASGKDPADG